MPQVNQEILDRLNLHLSAEPMEQPSQSIYEEKRMADTQNYLANDPYDSLQRAKSVESPRPSVDYVNSRFQAGAMGRRSDYDEEDMAYENIDQDGEVEEYYTEDDVDDDGYDVQRPVHNPQQFAGRKTSASYEPEEEYEDYDDSDSSDFVDDNDSYSDDNDSYSDDSYSDDSYSDNSYSNSNAFEDNDYDNGSSYGDDDSYDNENYSDDSDSGYDDYSDNSSGGYGRSPQGVPTEEYIAPEIDMGYEPNIGEDDDMLNYENKDELNMFRFEDRRIPAYNGSPVGDYSMEALLGEYSRPSEPMNVNFDAKSAYNMGGNVGVGNLDELLGLGKLNKDATLDVNAQRMMAKKTAPPAYENHMETPDYIHTQFGDLGNIGRQQRDNYTNFDTRIDDDYFGFHREQPTVRDAMEKQDSRHIPSQDIFGFGGLNGLNSKDDINKVGLSSAVSLEESLSLGKMNMGDSKDLFGFDSFSDRGQRQGVFESGTDLRFGIGLDGRMDSPSVVNNERGQSRDVFNVEEALFGGTLGFGLGVQSMMARKTTAPSKDNPQQLKGGVKDLAKKLFHESNPHSETGTESIKRNLKKNKKEEETETAIVPTGISSVSANEPEVVSVEPLKSESNYDSISSKSLVESPNGYNGRNHGQTPDGGVIDADYNVVQDPPEIEAGEFQGTIDVDIPENKSYAIYGPDKIKVKSTEKYICRLDNNGTLQDVNNVLWTSSDTSVGIVDSSGTVKGVKQGTFTLTAKKDGNFLATKVISVVLDGLGKVGNFVDSWEKKMENKNKGKSSGKISFSTADTGMEGMFSTESFATGNDSKHIVGDFKETNYDPLHFQNVEMLETMTHPDDVAGKFGPASSGNQWDDTFGSFGGASNVGSSARTEAPMQSFSSTIGTFGMENQPNNNMGGGSPSDDMFGVMGGSGWAYESGNPVGDNYASQGNNGGFSDMFGFKLGEAYNRGNDDSDNDGVFVAGDTPKKKKIQKETTSESQNNGNNRLDADELFKQSNSRRMTADDFDDDISDTNERFRRSTENLRRAPVEDDLDEIGVGSRSPFPKSPSENNNALTHASRRYLPSSSSGQQMQGYYQRVPRRQVMMDNQYYGDNGYEQQRTDPRSMLSRMIDSNSDYTEQFNRGFDFDTDPSALGAFGMGAISGAIFGKSGALMNSDETYYTDNQDYLSTGNTDVGINMGAMIGGDGVPEVRNAVEFYDADDYNYREPQIESDINGMIGFVNSNDNQQNQVVSDVNGMIGLSNAPQQMQPQASRSMNRVLPQTRRPKTRVIKRAPASSRRVTTKVIQDSNGGTTTITTTTVGKTKYKKTVKTTPAKKSTAKKSTAKKTTTKKSTSKKSSIFNSDISKRASENMFATGLETKSRKSSASTQKKQTVKSKKNESDFNKLIWG